MKKFVDVFTVYYPLESSLGREIFFQFWNLFRYFTPPPTILLFTFWNFLDIFFIKKK